MAAVIGGNHKSITKYSILGDNKKVPFTVT